MDVSNGLTDRADCFEARPNEPPHLGSKVEQPLGRAHLRHRPLLHLLLKPGEESAKGCAVANVAGNESLQLRRILKIF